MPEIKQSDYNKQLKAMIDALESLNTMQAEYERTMMEVLKENQFLSDTINTHKLSKITSERNELMAKVRDSEKNSKAVLAQAEKIRSEYDVKLDNISQMLVDAKAKQDGINDYIDKEAKKRILGIKKDYEKKKSANDKALAKHKSENNIEYKKKKKKWLIISVVAAVITGVVGLMLGIII